MRPDLVLKSIGRYALYGEFAQGGTASVHFGRLLGPAGFGRTVAIKRLHAEVAREPEFVRMLIAEARLAARVSHPNVVQTLDVIVSGDQTHIVMEYVRGAPLSMLMKRSRKRGQRIDTSIATAVMSNVLHGLHAAHEATDEQGQALRLVHRDISPQNILCGIDGVARVLDFGIAKASGATQMTREGYVKGKLAYMAPEQIEGAEIDRRSDVFAAAVVLWELLTGQRLFGRGGQVYDVVGRIMNGLSEPPSRHAPGLAAAFDTLTARCLEPDVNLRMPTARDFAMALEECSPMAPPSEIGAWVEELAGDVLEVHREHLREIESSRAEGEALAIANEAATVPGHVHEATTVSGRHQATTVPGHPASDANAPTVVDPPSAEPEKAARPPTQPDEWTPDVTAVATSDHSPRRGALMRRGIAAILVVGAVGVVPLALSFGGREAPRSEVTSPASSSPTTSEKASAPAPPPGLRISAVASHEAPRSLAPSDLPQIASPFAAHSPPPPNSVAAPRTRPVPAHNRTDTTVTVKSRSGECSPPFEIDAQGFKTYKLECL